MKKLIILSLFVLAGCSTYNPKLASSPQNTAKYQRDLQDCRNLAKPSNGAETSILMGGLIGLAIHDATNPGANDFESENSIVNNCLSEKGYVVKND